MADVRRSPMKVNILFSKEKGKVLYLEAGKDFIDLMMALLRMPTANVLKLLIENRSLSGSKIGIFNIFSSAEKLDDSFMKVKKDIVLNPSPTEGSSQLRLLGGARVEKVYFTCPQLNHRYLSQEPGKPCPSCAATMTKKLKPLEKGVDYTCPLFTCSMSHRLGPLNSTCPDCNRWMNCALDILGSFAPAHSEGFVKETVTFMVTDDLQFFPSSTIKSLSLLNAQGVKSMVDLGSFEATVTRDHALALVLAALTSISALTDVFGNLASRNEEAGDNAAARNDEGEENAAEQGDEGGGGVAARNEESGGSSVRRSARRGASTRSGASGGAAAQRKRGRSSV